MKRLSKSESNKRGANLPLTVPHKIRRYSVWVGVENLVGFPCGGHVLYGLRLSQFLAVLLKPSGD